MALDLSTLSDNIAGALSDMTEPGAPDANLRLSQAFGEYFKGATVSEVTALDSVVNLAVEAMASHLVFTEEGSSDSAAAAFQNALAAFWVVIQGSSATCWPGCTAGAPPANVASIAELMPPVFAANNMHGVTREEAAQNLATFLHTVAGLGGTVTIALAPVPIL